MAGTQTKLYTLKGVNGSKEIGTVTGSTGAMELTHGLGMAYGITFSNYGGTTICYYISHYESFPVSGAITVISATTAASYSYEISGY